MENHKKEEGQSSLFKFILLSLAGVIIFFIPVWDQTIPVVKMIQLAKEIGGSWFDWVAILSSLLLGGELVGAFLFQIPTLQKYFAGEKVRLIFWSGGIAIVLLKMLNAPLGFIRHPQIGGAILNLGSTVFVTIAIAGSMVVLIIRSGLVEFIAVLMEPIMRPVFRLPGEAAVNILSSFISSASVGVYFTEQYYKSKSYTTRQACSVVSSFSVISVGYIGVVASLAGIDHMYGELLVTSFVLVLIMGAIMIRIPPLSLIPDKYMDGSQLETIAEKLSWKERFGKALDEGKKCANEFTLSEVVGNIIQSFQFAQKIVGVMIPTVVLVLVLVHYTPLFHWLGYPVAPILSLFGIPDASLAAPSVLIGIVEVSLPSILIGGTAAAVQTRFFIALLSIVQIIFFSEAGNAILASDIPLGFRQLIALFLMRTAVAVPLVALVSKIICGF